MKPPIVGLFTDGFASNVRLEIQKSYSNFVVESPNFILQTSETTSPNASQTAIDHHPLTLCLRISENSTTTTISIEGPDRVDAKNFGDPIRCFVFSQLSSGFQPFFNAFQKEIQANVKHE